MCNIYYDSYIKHGKKSYNHNKIKENIENVKSIKSTVKVDSIDRKKRSMKYNAFGRSYV